MVLTALSENAFAVELTEAVRLAFPPCTGYEGRKRRMVTVEMVSADIAVPASKMYQMPEKTGRRTKADVREIGGIYNAAPYGTELSTPTGKSKFGVRYKSNLGRTVSRCYYDVKLSVLSEDVHRAGMHKVGLTRHF